MLLVPGSGVLVNISQKRDKNKNKNLICRFSDSCGINTITMTDFKLTQKISQNSELEERHTSGSSKPGQASSSTIIHHFIVTSEDPLDHSCEVCFSEDTDAIFQEMWYIYEKQQI